ncbi:hypothetical protein SAMN04487948_11014 [Halogranum amylolyticum]|uniref:Uncharacterized protein n=1 Tax=Halogranum amylolyticum TaxID=660520 RepID=A0A1H8U8H5_9EURY|nr:hypothetical protein SAMN04487948_11014 [Halogranum amylolyticum]
MWHPSTPLERELYRVFRLSSAGSAVTIISFVGYLCIGSALHIARVYTPSFPLMSFSDPVFTILCFLTGGLICLLSGSLTCLTLLVSVKDANAEFVLLTSLIAFGFGAATVRITVNPILAWLAALRPV